MLCLTGMLPEHQHHSRAHGLMPRAGQEGGDGTDAQHWLQL